MTIFNYDFFKVAKLLILIIKAGQDHFSSIVIEGIRVMLSSFTKNLASAKKHKKQKKLHKQTQRTTFFIYLRKTSKKKKIYKQTEMRLFSHLFFMLSKSTQKRTKATYIFSSPITSA